MRIVLHIGPEQVGADRLQQVLDDKREQLLAKGVLVPRSAGRRNHTRLYMAVSDPAHVDPLRFNRDVISYEKQTALRETLARELAQEIAAHDPHTLILSASQLGASLHSAAEIRRLREFLHPFGETVEIVAHVEDQARLLTRVHAAQVMEGRAAPLSAELDLAREKHWWDGALALAPDVAPEKGLFLETQAPPFWLDFAALVERWEAAFGAGAVRLRGYDEARFYGEAATEELRAAFRLEATIGKAAAAVPPAAPSAAFLARARAMNALFLQILRDGKRIIPRQLWRSLLAETEIPGAPIAPGALAPVSQRFAADNARLAEMHPDLDASVFRPDPPRGDWTEADPEFGFRATQYLLSFMHRIDKASRAERKARAAELDRLNGAPAAPQPVKPAEPRAILPPVALENYRKLRGGPFAPHNKLGAVNEEELAAPFAATAPRVLPEGSSGNVIVGCMKNEAPYIVEWVAYHRAIGVDDFLIYTNGCEDGTDAILSRMQEMGLLQHRDNDAWKGNSPQQHALNCALAEPVIRNAEWIIHIDVDEFINIRCGNGTLQDVFAACPDATNIAMTWRLFGHSGITELSDRFVIEQFDRCAPKFCPKPHTVWGFKTMFRNIGAYSKISCHRPNKLDPDLEACVKWVNGSGRDMTGEALKNGWRNSKTSIGYDLLQLNHYALRSAESFLIKRQRGRALHVDRSIGLNYWIRMDWNDHRDVTIQRNLPRLRGEVDRLLADEELRRLHEAGMRWHRDKARELRATAEFEELYREALDIRLGDTERVAYALALDMES